MAPRHSVGSARLAATASSSIGLNDRDARWHDLYELDIGGKASPAT